MYDFDLSDYILIMPERPFKKSFRKINFEGTQINYLLTNLFEKVFQDFSRGLVVKTPCFHCRGSGFDPWSVN